MAESASTASVADSRDAKKAAAALERSRREAAAALSSKIRAALRAPEHDAAAAALLAAHPAEATAARAAAARTAARKAQEAANAAEVEDDAATLGRGVARLAALLRGARHAVVYTGAGVSTSARIPDYRGPQGIWTQHKRGAHNASSAARAQLMAMPFEDARPTAAHLALAELHRRGHIAAVVSQNVDGLHLRSGVPAAALCELHGNVFRERCAACGAEPLRGFDVTARSAYHRHGTGRACGCGAPLADTIVYFGEKVHGATLARAQAEAAAADLCIFVGSSLKVLQSYKFIWHQPRRPPIVIVNLQPTPKDRSAALKIRGRCDDVFTRLLAALDLPPPPPYDPAADPVARSAAENPPPPPPPMHQASAIFEREGALPPDDDGDDSGAEAEAAAAAPRQPAKKRRKKAALSTRRAPQPRAFPRGAPAASREPTSLAPPSAAPSAAAVAVAPAVMLTAAEAEAQAVRLAAAHAAQAAAALGDVPTPAAAPVKCRGGCGFFGAPDTGLCSKCALKFERESAGRFF